MTSSRLRALGTLTVVGALIATTGMVAASASAEATTDGLVAHYAFTQTSGTSVPNVAPDATLGAATVRNGADADWTGDALTLRGGAKDSTGNWVELPDDLLAGANAASVVAEVRPTQQMLDGFHFVWNVGNDSSATEYFFASLNCGSGRTPLVGLKAGGAERLAASRSCGVTADRWVNVASVVDADGTGRLFLDGILVAEGDLGATPGAVLDQSLNTIGRSPWPDPLFQGAISSFRVYDRALDAAEVSAVSAEEAQTHRAEFEAEAQALLDGLALTDLTTNDDIDLPTAGGEVTWTSSNPDIVSDDGTVTAPLQGEPAQQVTLTATVEIRGVTASEAITVTVIASDETAQDRIERTAQRYVIAPVIASGTTLPEPPDGVSATVLGATGGLTVTDTITTDAIEAVTGEVTIALTDDATGAQTTRTFVVRVIPMTLAHSVLAYDRTPTSEAEANNADVALSMHLAVQQDGAWTPLNDNYGIFFARTSETPGPNGTTNDIIRSLRDPHLFRLADGDFGIVATRTLRGGGIDGAATGSVLFARSTDLLSYDEIGMVDLGTVGGVNAPAAIWDSATETYVVTWTSDAGTPMYTTFGDLADASTRGEIQRGTVAATAGTAPSDIADFATGNTLAVTDDIITGLRTRFAPIVNTGVSPIPGVTVEQGTALDAGALAPRVSLQYSDGSEATRAITWDAAALDAVDTAMPGEYTVTGTVSHPVYPTPFADERADPSVFRYELNGEAAFMMIATEDLNLNPIDPANGPHMPFRIATSIEDLSDEAIREGRNTEVDLLRAGDLDAAGQAMTGCFWAPEFHVIDGVLSILFMPCYDGANGRPDMWTGRSSIIQLQKDDQGNDLDPSDPASWSAARQVTRADGSALNLAQGISLDMTFFEDSGQSYYAWQMLGSVFIARMDPSDPLRLTSDPVRIVAPEYAWDNLIAEGPNVREHDGRLFLIYSGSSVGDTYTTGLATATGGEGVDLTDPSAWTTLNYPIQKSGPFNGAWQLGTGHGMWSTDEDGNPLYVFHARTDNGGLTGRDTFVRRVHWAADGMPVFDQESDEEVAPAFATVTTTVTVAPTQAPITVTAEAVCRGRSVTHLVTVQNDTDGPVAVRVQTEAGEKSRPVLRPGAHATLSLRAGVSELPAGTVQVDTTDRAGNLTTQQLGIDAARCG